MRICNPTNWDKPPLGLFKLKFDGASKGNPRDVGFRGAIRDYTGTIHNVYWGDLGIDSNNATELSELTK